MTLNRCMHNRTHPHEKQFYQTGYSLANVSMLYFINYLLCVYIPTLIQVNIYDSNLSPNFIIRKGNKRRVNILYPGTHIGQLVLTYRDSTGTFHAPAMINVYNKIMLKLMFLFSCSSIVIVCSCNYPRLSTVTARCRNYHIVFSCTLYTVIWDPNTLSLSTIKSHLSSVLIFLLWKFQGHIYFW
jgi:hypothetical protein